MLSAFSYTNLPENCWASLAGFDWLSWNDIVQGYPTEKGEADLEQAAVGESCLAQKSFILSWSGEGHLRINPLTSCIGFFNLACHSCAPFKIHNVQGENAIRCVQQACSSNVDLTVMQWNTAMRCAQRLLSRVQHVCCRGNSVKNPTSPSLRECFELPTALTLTSITRPLGGLVPLIGWLPFAACPQTQAQCAAVIGKRTVAVGHRNSPNLLE